jgi:hopanoid-associated phosphorylase
VGRLGIVTGLRTEAQCLAALAPAERPAVRCAGADAGRAHEAAQALLTDGCDALLSFGIAGGLDPKLQPGDTIVADAVVVPAGQRITTAEAWRNALWATLNDLPTARIATVVGSDGPVSTVAEKRAIQHASGASIVDMESHAVAEVAGDADLPFLALRVVADTSADVVPGWLPNCIGDQGEIRPIALTAGIIAHPRDIHALVRLAKNSSAALAGLRRALLLAGPRFRFG